MNFLELINKCLLELNYKQVSSFNELIKQDHQKIISFLNIVNSEICQTENWKFLLRRKSLTLPSQTFEISNDISGKILYLFIDGQKYNYSENVEPLLSGKPKSKIYTSMADKLLLPKFDKEKTLEIVYYTKNCVTDENGNEKEEFTEANDKSLIPEPFAQQLLIYGTCLRVKANPQHIKFAYWLSMYKEALLNLKSKTSVSAQTSPVVRLFRF